MASPLRLRARGSGTERRGPLTAAQEQLLAPLHHVAADGWTLWLLCAELSRRSAGGEVPRGPEGDCIDHARRQREWLESPAAERELAWWLERLQSASPRLAGEPRIDMR